MERIPVISTPRLILREIEEFDAFDMYEYACLPIIGPNAGWQPHTSPSETKTIIKLLQGKKKYGQLGVFAVVWKENNKMIGTIELHTYVRGHKAELGYTINPDYWGKGVACEASKYVIAWGFESLGLKRIECTAFTDNHQSRRVCEKLGLTYEGVRRKGYLLYDGTIRDIDCYAIIDDDYFQRKYNNTWW
ncbi:MAG: GNAT family N-acetyltransferase [Acholeplasmataceae bacterium]|nr:GNAT family N-acetyltransferase [Acholeplasmataceae bacterium]